MKKITLLLFCLMSVIIGFSQSTLYSEDFESDDISAWTFYDVNTVVEDDWFLTDETNWDPVFGIYTGNFLASFSWNGVNYSPDDIAVSPQFSIPTGATGVMLDFFSGSGSDPNFFSEHYAVYITTANDQATILAATPVFEETLGAVGGSVKSVDISVFAGMDVYISFRHFSTTGQWVLGIDEIDVTAATLGIEDFETNTFKHFYNNDSDILTLESSNLSLDKIELYNIIGQQVLNIDLSQTKETINLSSLKDGIYIAKVNIEGNTQTLKLLKN